MLLELQKKPRWLFRGYVICMDIRGVGLVRSKRLLVGFLIGDDILPTYVL